MRTSTDGRHRISRSVACNAIAAWQMYSAVTDLAPARSSLVLSEGTVYFLEAKINVPAKLAET